MKHFLPPALTLKKQKRQPELGRGCSLPTIYQTPLGYPANESCIVFFQTPSPLKKIRPMHPSNLQSRSLEMSITHYLERAATEFKGARRASRSFRKNNSSSWRYYPRPKDRERGSLAGKETIKGTFPKTPSSALYSPADSRPLPAAQSLGPHPRGASRAANTRQSGRGLASLAAVREGKAGKGWRAAPTPGASRIRAGSCSSAVAAARRKLCGRS